MAGGIAVYTQIAISQTALFLLLSIGLLLNIQLSCSALPISHPPKPVDGQRTLEDLDLRVVDYRLPEGGEPLLGDDLILEFKSENLSGIVKLSRIDELAAKPKNVRRKGKRNKKKNYDQKGAMYFAVSVVSLYGLSIGVLVAFSLRRDWDEDEVKNFQRSWVKMDHQMEKQEKQRAKRLMTKAIIAIHQPRKNSLAAVTSQAVYMALAPVSLNGSAAVNTGERRASRETTIWNDLPPPMGTIREGAGTGTDVTDFVGVSPSPTVSLDHCHVNPMLSHYDGPLNAPLASTSGECRDWDLDHFEGEQGDGDGDDGEGVEREEAKPKGNPGHLEAQMEQMDRMLEEGQLEGDFSVDLPDEDFGLGEAGYESYREAMMGDTQSHRHGSSSKEDDEDETVIITSPHRGGSIGPENPQREPSRGFTGVFSPSLPFMDDELSPNWPDSQVWELSPTENDQSDSMDLPNEI